MKKQNVLACLCLFFLVITPAWAANLDQLKNFISQVKTAKGEFEQQLIKADASQNKNQQTKNNSSGYFEFSRPGRFIWVYQKPFEQVLQSDGERLYIYDKDLKQVIEEMKN